MSRYAPGASLEKSTFPHTSIHPLATHVLLEPKEPHGMLLEGVVAYLPRPRFHVTVCALGGRVSRRLEAGADRVVRLPLTLDGARIELEKLR